MGRFDEIARRLRPPFNPWATALEQADAPIEEVVTTASRMSTVGVIEEVVVEARNPCSVPVFPKGESVDKNIVTALTARRSILADVGFMPPHAVAATDITRRLDYFYYQVRNKAPWDYKQLGPAFQPAGNFNFGATGASLGIPDQVLYRGAAAAQIVAGTSQPQFGNPLWVSPYGDDPLDQVWIQRGIDYFNSKCSSSP
jgi:hypothetical protein